MGRPITITKLDHCGRERTSYSGEIVYADQTLTVVRCRWAAGNPFQVGSFCLTEGDILFEHYYAGKPFNILAVFSPTGQYKGAYCNVTAPPEITPDAIRWRDLVLDLLVLPDGATIELDRDELLALPSAEPLLTEAEAGLAALRQWLAERPSVLDRGDLAR